MRIVSIVPIKLENERLPGKNTMLLGGKPLISYCLETLLEVKAIERRYVYCSSEKIMFFLPKGIEFLKRTEELDLPTTNFSQIFSEFICEIDADIYVYAHATAPFLKPVTIKRGIDAVLSGDYDSAFCAERIQDFLWKDGKSLNYDPTNLPRCQDLPAIYRETSGVYIFKRDVFAKSHRRIGERPCILEVGRVEAIDINTAEDFACAEAMVDHLFKV